MPYVVLKHIVDNLGDIERDFSTLIYVSHLHHHIFKPIMECSIKLHKFSSLASLSLLSIMSHKLLLVLKSCLSPCVAGFKTLPLLIYNITFVVANKSYPERNLPLSLSFMWSFYDWCDG